MRCQPVLLLLRIALAAFCACWMKSAEANEGAFDSLCFFDDSSASEGTPEFCHTLLADNHFGVVPMKERVHIDSQRRPPDII